MVVRVRAAFPTVPRKVFLFNSRRFTRNQAPFFTPTRRPARPRTQAVGVMDRLFAGPVPGERARGVRLVTSDATGYRDLTIAHGIARHRTVRLTGDSIPGCLNP